MDQYERIHQAVQENVGLDVPFKKLKFIYENAEWRQVKPDTDLVQNFHEIVNKCIDGNIIQESACLSDYSIWTMMKTTKPTEDLYQFIHYHASNLKMQVNNDIVEPLNHVFSAMNTHKISSLSDFITNFINWDFVLNILDFIGGFFI